MAEPTLKDVLNAIARLERSQGEMRAEMATKSEMAEGFAAVDRRFDRVDKELAELDKDLNGHMAVHREIEKDIEAIKRRPARTAARPARRR